MSGRRVEENCNQSSMCVVKERWLLRGVGSECDARPLLRLIVGYRQRPRYSTARRSGFSIISDRAGPRCVEELEKLHMKFQFVLGDISRAAADLQELPSSPFSTSTTQRTLKTFLRRIHSLGDKISGTSYFSSSS